MKKLLFFLCLSVLMGCYESNITSPIPDKVMGMRPVYATREQVATIKTLAPRALKNVGKIYVKGKYLFINEVDEGFHIFDNSDPAKPLAISFLAVYGSTDMAANGNLLYVNNKTDLVALDITNPRAVSEVSRAKDAFPYPAYPPNYSGWFECADPERGVPIKWESAELIQPKCRK